jgi:Domain of unknown function (DUF4276)
LTRRIGLIAEDASDVVVVKILAKKITSKALSISHFVGKGCGPIARKAGAWCKVFDQKGCDQVLVMHDLDRNKVDELKKKLTQALEKAPQGKKSVVIPVEELEAWLLCDEAAIATALKLKKNPKAIHHPEQVKSPKEHLAREVLKASKNACTYVNTVHNHLIADALDIRKVRKKCPSFGEFEEFFA